MPGPDYHWRTHLPGGTDPVPFQLPFVYAHNDAGGQTVTADDELDLIIARTNAPDTFRWDKAGDRNGLLIVRPGLYAAYSYVSFAAGSLTVARSIYTANSTQSGGALSGLGTEFGQNHFALGQGQSQSSVGQVTATNTISKGVLEHVAIAPISGFTPTDPPRLAVILDHLGSDFTLNSGLKSSITIYRIGDIGAEPPAP